MNTVESILQDDALAREIAKKLPQLDRGAMGNNGAARGMVEMPQPELPAANARARIMESVSFSRINEAASFNEAIIKRFGRPSLLIRNDTFEIPAADTWKAYLFPNKSKLDRALPSVGRVELRSLTPPYIGTAWMVTPDVAVTNRHVALEFARRQGDKWNLMTDPTGQPVAIDVDFKEEYMQTNSFEAELVDILFVADLVDSEPDLAFIRLRAVGRPLPPPIPLYQGDIRNRQKIAVIGYPAEDFRNGAADQQRIFSNIFDVKRLAPGEVTSADSPLFFTHDCSTLGGNSGSVVLDIETGAAVGLHFAGEYLQNNYAVRADKLREYLKQIEGDHVFAVPKPAPKLESFEATKAELRHRDGYHPRFLGDDDLTVPLPKLSKVLQPKAVVVDEEGEGLDKYLLNYTHFSITMHGERRMAIYTASNIDGSESRRIKRKSDVWGFDPRIDSKFQFGNELYANNDLDRGHLVRRLDPAWGTEKQAKEAEKDTFFFTNCTPQHAQFNQHLWLELEDYILNSADTQDFKACIFTGPIFTDDDRPYRDAFLPLSYWKVAVMVHSEREKLSATGYIVSQKDLVSDLEFVFGQFKTYQVSLAELEKRTSLDFGPLTRFDPLRRQEAAGPHELQTVDDVRL